MALAGVWTAWVGDQLVSMRRSLFVSHILIVLSVAEHAPVAAELVEERSSSSTVLHVHGRHTPGDGESSAAPDRVQVIASQDPTARSDAPLVICIFIAVVFCLCFC